MIHATSERVASRNLHDALRPPAALSDSNSPSLNRLDPPFHLSCKSQSINPDLLRSIPARRPESYSKRICSTEWVGLVRFPSRFPSSLQEIDFVGPFFSTTCTLFFILCKRVKAHHLSFQAVAHSLPKHPAGTPLPRHKTGTIVPYSRFSLLRYVLTSLLLFVRNSLP